MDCSLLGSFVRGILQARILEWVSFPFPGDLPDSGMNLGFLHCRWLLYHLSHQGSPKDSCCKLKKLGGHTLRIGTTLIHRRTVEGLKSHTHTHTHTELYVSNVSVHAKLFQLCPTLCEPMDCSPQASLSIRKDASNIYS